MSVPTAPYPVVPQGAGAYRRSLRSVGPLLALVPPLVLGGAAALLLLGNEAAWRGVLGFVCAVLAAPLMLATGVPIRPGSTPMLAGIAASAVMWVAIGVWASRRATRRPAADWRDFWREYRWLAVPVWIGTLVAAVLANLWLGRSLL